MSEEIARRLRSAALAGAVASQPQRICELCVELLEVGGAGITSVPGGVATVVHATDAVAAQIEELQLTLGEGPCIDAMGSGAPVLVADLARPLGVAVDRWRGFLPGAVAAGAAAVFAFPLRIGSIRVGAMDLYLDRPGELGAARLAAALLAADAAAVALVHQAWEMVAREDASLEGDDPRIHQATGMIQVQLGVPTPEAYLALRARAFASGKSLREVAIDVVERRLRLTTEDS